MNITQLLYQSKTSKFESCILPNPSVYVQPQQAWYVCLKVQNNIVTLKKKKQNTSLKRFLGDQNDGEKLVCVYERFGCFESQLQKVKEIKKRQQNFQEEMQKQKQRSSSLLFKDKQVAFIIMESTDLKKKLDEKNIQEDEIIREEVLKNLPQNFVFSRKDVITLYRSSSKMQKQLFWVCHHNNYLKFQHQNIQINTHMKKKIDQYLGKLIKILHEIIQKEQEKVKLEIKSFKVWFSKNQTNNEVYPFYLTDLKFKYWKDIFYQSEEKDVPVHEEDNYLKQLAFDFKEKINEKAVSLKLKSRHLNKNMTLEPSVKTHLATIQQSLHQCNYNIPLKKRDKIIELKNKERNQEILCNSCSYLIDCQDQKFEVTLQNIPKIQYCLQVKMVRTFNYNEIYDFVKICKSCYDLYLKVNEKQNGERRVKSIQRKTYIVPNAKRQHSIKMYKNTKQMRSITSFTDLSKISFSGSAKKQKQKKNLDQKLIQKRKIRMKSTNDQQKSLNIKSQQKNRIRRNYSQKGRANTSISNNQKSQNTSTKLNTTQLSQAIKEYENHEHQGKKKIAQKHFLKKYRLLLEGQEEEKKQVSFFL